MNQLLPFFFVLNALAILSIVRSMNAVVIFEYVRVLLDGFE